MKKIEDFLHLYLGCKFVLRIKDTCELSGEMYLGVDALGAALTTKKEDKITPILLLRPLSDIKEDECILIASVVYTEIVPDEQKAIIGKNFIDYFFHEIPLSGKEWHAANEFEISHMPEITRILLSKHIDLFGLIEARLAFDKTKIHEAT